MDLNDAIEQIQQPRSRYQLERFVIGQHDTVEMQFYQCVIELNDMLHKYRLAEISQVRMEREIARLENSDEEDADLDLAENMISLKQLLILIREVASRQYIPKLHGYGNTDFQVTRGLLGISL